MNPLFYLAALRFLWASFWLSCFLLPALAFSQPQNILPQPVPQQSGGQFIGDAGADVAADLTAHTDASESDRNQVLVEALKGLVFTSNGLENTKGAISSGIVIDQLNVPAEAEFRARMADFLNQPLSLALLDQVNLELVQHYVEHDQPVVDAYAVADQDITEGVVTIAVLTGKLGQVRVEGGEHFSQQSLYSQIRLNPGDLLSTAVLQEDLAWLNNNPFRRVDMLLERGQGDGETDVILQVEDTFPVRVYAGVDDSGTDLTGAERWTAGVNWGDAFGLGHQLNYQLSSSFDFDALNAHTFSYQAPLRSRHTASLFGAYVKSDPAETGDGFDLQGESWQLGFGYNIPLASDTELSHNLNIGGDFKRSNNDLQFGSLNVFDSYTNVVQLRLGYNASRADEYGATGLGLELVLSPGGINDGNSDTAFENSRANASADYQYATINLNRSTRLPNDFTWLLSAELQLSTANLLGSEQLGVGGYQSVRGYDEYQLVGDKGILLRNEIRAPSFSLLEPSNSGLADSMQFLTFLDYGAAASVDEIPGERGEDLLSLGLGVRYSINPYLSLRADYGWQLKSAESGVEDGRFHFSLVVGY